MSDLSNIPPNYPPIVAKAAQAIAANVAFLAIPAPTPAQTLAQVQLLTRECQAIIRVLIGQYDSTDGT